MIKRIFLTIIAVVIVAGVVFFALAWHATLPEVTTPEAASFNQAEIDRGRALAGIGDCVVCHTSEATKPYAGNRAMPTGFGTIYTANITPDADSGIGRWSEQAFVRAMREGVSREGSYLFPAFPYTHFTILTDDDLSALYAFLMTRQPISEKPSANTMKFPYNIRLLQSGWQMLYFDDERFTPDETKSEKWNRGAYLAEGLGHCSACHTPRNQFGAEETAKQYAGAVIDDWYAPALNGENQAPLPWTEDEIYRYLLLGGTERHGVAAGSMSAVVHDGLSEASEDDISALAVYFSSIAGTDTESEADQEPRQIITDAHARASTDRSHGEHIFTAACAGCHYNTAEIALLNRPELSLNSALSAPDPVNLIRITLEGVSIDDGLPNLMMPGFGPALSDEDIVSLVIYLRRTQTGLPPWENVEARVRGLRQ